VVSLDSMIGFYVSSGYLSIFGVLLLCGFGLPVPEDITILAGGIISGTYPSIFNVHIMLLVCFFGVIIGDLIVYSLGRYFGDKIFKTRIGKRIFTHKRYNRITKSFEKNGKMVLFAARFMPGLRTPIFLTAGMTRFVGFVTFLCIDGIAAAVSVPIWIYLGYYGASHREKLAHWIKDTKIAIVIILAVIIIIYCISRYFKNRLAKAELVNDEESTNNK
jgi:membrane protein DedA with SNARE-associated domain